MRELEEGRGGWGGGLDEVLGDGVGLEEGVDVAVGEANVDEGVV